ncbi:MAG: monofunctional biosynthetic peptidoglycan transglycosylase [Desulfobulbus sp.]|nr:MAG: monofunctional biosynthetic peptidoglycan transglycosylase [Desulfobulbus sp.]
MRKRIRKPVSLPRRLMRVALWSVLILFALPALGLLTYRLIDPPCTPLMLARLYLPEKDQEIRQLRHDAIALEEVSRWMLFAVLAGEDQKFLQHRGFDLQAIEQAVRHNKSHRRKRGASTISQQTAKNVFLWEGRSWLRKGLEVPLTLAIELLWGKRRILEVYLNVAEFGPGVFGIEAAARHWYDVPAGRLSRRQAALLAASLPSPLRANPARPSPQLARRASWIEGQIRRMDQEAALAALKLERPAGGKR